MRRWIVGAVLVASMLLLAACGGGDETSQREPGAGVESDTTTEAASAVLTMADWDAVVASPHGHEGDRARGIIGRAFVVERGAEGTAVQMYTTSDLTDGNTIVYILDQALARQIAEQDYLRVSGTLGEAFTGENAFGAQITAPVVLADDVTEISPAQAIVAANPPVATRRLNVAAEQAGMRVTLERVDRLPSGGRVVVEAINGTGSNVTIYGSSAGLVQGRRQVEPEYTELPDFPSEMRPGVRATAVITFPSMRAGPARLILPWYPESFDISSDDFELPFRVP